MLTVGVLCAGDAELEPFLPYIVGDTVSKKAMLNFHAGVLRGVSVVALFSGVCKTNAAIAAQILIDTYNVDMIINVGTAGGMSKIVTIFDTVISTEVAHYDVHEDILTKFHPWNSSIYFKADSALLDISKRAVERLPRRKNVFFGRMVTGEKFIDETTRGEVNASLKPLSVDMETASIAQVCCVNKIPFIAIRTITDNATHDGNENFEKNCKVASCISRDVLLEILSEIHHSLL